MIPMRRVSIAWLMALVSLIASDLTIVKAFYEGLGPNAVYFIAILPLLNALLLALPKVIRRGDHTPFWVHFEALGWVVIGLFSGFHALNDIEVTYYPIFWLIDIGVLPRDGPAGIAIEIALVLVIDSIPMIVVAWSCARLSSRYRIVIERR